jgi:hypothetical protein
MWERKWSGKAPVRLSFQSIAIGVLGVIHLVVRVSRNVLKFIDILVRVTGTHVVMSSKKESMKSTI